MFFILLIKGKQMLNVGISAFSFLLLKSISRINVLYLNIFLFVLSIITFILRIKEIMYLNLSDINFYSSFFMSLLVFVYFLVDTLKEVKIDPFKVLFHHALVFVLMTFDFNFYVFSLMFFGLMRKNNIEIGSFHDYLIVFCVMSYFFFESFYVSSFYITTFFILVLFGLSIFKRMEYIVYKSALVTSSFLFVFTVEDYLFVLIYIYMLLMSVTASDFIKLNLYNKFPKLKIIETKAKQFRNLEKLSNTDLEMKEEINHIKTHDLLRFNFLNVESRYTLTLLLLAIFSFSILIWSWNL